jgi:YD repeat-containing protein
VSAYTPNALNQYTGSVGLDSITNGPEHEIKSYQNVNYSYINDGRLTSQVSGANGTYTFKYDALGRTVGRTLGGVA